MNSSVLSSTDKVKNKKPNPQAWYRPTFSPEHGVYVILFVSFLTGASAARDWTWNTTLALICAFCAFQAEHPFVLQIKQRKSLKPRFLIWGGLYGTIALAIALYLSWQTPVLLWLYAVAIAAWIVDAIAVFYRKQKSVANEWIAFAATCLSAPVVYGATTGTLSPLALGLWLLNALFFSNSIFTVKLRKQKHQSLVPGAIERAIATAIVLGLYVSGILPLVTALAFVVVLVKFAFIVWQREWYSNAPIQSVAMLETGSAILFGAIACLSLLPSHLGQ